MYPYIPITLEDEKIMLESIGVNSTEDLLQDIPEELRFKGTLDIGDAMSELELTKHMQSLAKKNTTTDDLTCFLGAGAYDHYIPSIIKHMTSRSEFYTAYTPYQPEISQGTLQAIFEYQSMICELTGMDAANASLYDGATACAEAAMLAAASKKRKSVIVSKTVHPETREVLKTYMKYKGIEVVEIDHADGVTDVEKLKAAISKDTAGVITQSPNFFGIVEDMTDIEKITHDNKALLIMNVNPMSLAILKTPGDIGADIAVGDAQVFGNSLSFGGPYIGFMAVKSKYMRKMPGRIVGQTEDVDGKRAFVLTIQAREQHIRREKATSNICSNQGLCAVVVAIYLSTMGKEGLKEVALQNVQKAHYAYNEMIKSGKYKPVFDKPFFNEFVVKSDIESSKVNSELLKNGIVGGYELEKDYPLNKNEVLFCVTEKRTKNEIDNLVAVLEGIK